MSDGIDLNVVARLAQEAQRKAVVTLEDGSERQYLFNDKNKTYDPIERAAQLPRERRAVGDIQSLVDLVLAEADRHLTEWPGKAGAAGETNSSDNGLFITANFTKGGGQIFLEEDRGKKGAAIALVRQKSFALQTLEAGLSGWKGHEDFLLILANLAPWAENGKAIATAYRRVSLQSAGSFVSAPLLGEDATKSESYAIELRVGQGVTRANLPAELNLTIPLALRPIKSYAIAAAIDVSGAPKDGGGYVPKFRLIAPDLASLIELAVEDELAYFRAKTLERLPRLVLVRES